MILKRLPNCSSSNYRKRATLIVMNLALTIAIHYIVLSIKKMCTTLKKFLKKHTKEFGFTI